MPSFALKVIACVAMLIDHIGHLINQRAMRVVGRIAFPLYIFMIAEGVRHTKDKRKYLLRLLIFAFISEIPFDYFRWGQIWSFQGQNVFFTLFFGALAICLFQQLKGKHPTLAGISILACIYASVCLRSDYADYIGGVLVIFLVGITNSRKIRGVLLVAYAFYTYLLDYVIIQIAAFVTDQVVINSFSNLSYHAMLFVGMALPGLLILFYNGKRGPKMKWVFYIFYPAHLLILGLLHWRFGLI